MNPKYHKKSSKAWMPHMSVVSLKFSRLNRQWTRPSGQFIINLFKASQFRNIHHEATAVNNEPPYYMDSSKNQPKCIALSSIHFPQRNPRHGSPGIYQIMQSTSASRIVNTPFNILEVKLLINAFN